MNSAREESEQANQSPNSPIFVIGIGASAGGLEALEEFFRAMPTQTGLAFVVIQHLSPDFKSHMEELLSRQTAMPVTTAANDTEVKPDHVYLIPSKKEMRIAKGRLVLEERSSDRSLIHPIDQFFRSLAFDAKNSAVGVILSGTGSDGSRGVRDLHELGGLVLAQDSESAKFDGMPQSATATGCVDFVLRPSEIAKAVVAYCRDGVAKDRILYDLSSREGNESLTHPLDSLTQIFQMIRTEYGIDFHQYKSSTIDRRIDRRMKLLGTQDLGQYLEHLSQNSSELNNLYEDLLIGVTEFFRDPEAFEILRTEVATKLALRPVNDPVRIWVSACATGEEAYSVAMIFAEAFEQLGKRNEFKVFATDTHSQSLQVAAKGVFRAESVEKLSPELRTKYFRQVSGGYQVIRELRDYIVFAPHNLITDAPFTQMDLVCCRNMLIYLQPAAQKKALTLFHFALRTNGVLFLGPSESPGELSDEFKAIDQTWRLYRKKREARLPVGIEIPVGRNVGLPKINAFSRPVRTDAVNLGAFAVYEQLLNKKLGASILTDDTGELIHIFGGAEKYLKNRGGRSSNRLQDTIHDELRSTLAIAWQHAVQNHENNFSISTTFNKLEDPENLNITVELIPDESGSASTVLISFVDSVETNKSDENSQLHQPFHQERMESLETELRYSQENLQAVLEEMQASNEELQASNEELVASNEELQSTNEELHSVNEELYSVNAEHQRRVQELAQANYDMDNLLATTRVGVVFLDQDLVIRRFTPEVARILNLKNQDHGRSFEHFCHVFDSELILSSLRRILEDKNECELKLRHRDGTPYLMRALPYRSGDFTEGLVLTLIDISSLTEAEAEIHLKHMAIESAINGIIITDPRMKGNPIQYANPGFLALTGYSENEVIGKNCKFLQCEGTDPEVVRSIRSALDNREPIRVTILNQKKDGTRFYNDLQITPVANEMGQVTHFVGVQHDVTEQVTARQAIEEARNAAQKANEAKSGFLAMISHELRTPLTAILGFTEMLRDDSQNPEVVEKIDTIHRNGVYLLKLLNDILDLSKIDAGKMRFKLERVDIPQLVSEVEKLMSVRASQSSVGLRFLNTEDLPKYANTDEVRVRQILVNLISNAIKFSREKEVVVETSLQFREDKQHLSFAVIDSGPGMSNEQIGHLFTPFSSGSNISTDDGAGLGLSICKRLAEGINCQIEVQSALGRGSRFTLLVPYSEQSVSDSVEQAKEIDSEFEFERRDIDFPRLPYRILLADDRRDIWVVTKYFLEKCGATVLIASNGRQAIEIAERCKFEDDPVALILMDMQMPVMDGREAVKVLRRLGYKTPIIALTADAMEGEREACIEMGCNEYFPKPIDGFKLVRLILSLLQKS